VDAIEVLKSDLADIDISVKLEAMKNVPTVALAIGPERSANELILTIEDACFPDPSEGHALQLSDGQLGLSEEVLMEVALIMNSSMMPLLGGKDNVLPMLKLLQRLAMVDETVVRGAAVNSILDLAKECGQEFIEKHVLTVVLQLATAARWAARTSAADAIPRLFQYLECEKSKETCQEMVLKLTRDKMQLVRHEACSKVYQMIMPLGEHDMNELLSFVSQILKTLMNEQQQDFRCQVIQIVKTLLSVKDAALMGVCKEYLQYMFNDNDWRIRKMLISELMEIVDIAPAEFLNEMVLPNFVKCFDEKDTIVRTAALNMAMKFLSHEKLDLKNVKILFTNTIILKLVEDEMASVRDAASEAIPDILKSIFGSQATDEQKDFVVEIMEKFSCDDSGKVRANFLKALQKTLFCVGESNFVARIIPLVTKMLEDPKWRVRSSIFHHINLFAEMAMAGTMPEKDFRRILEICLKDPVGEARSFCVGRLANLGSILEPKWIITNLLNVFKSELANLKTKFHVRAVAIRIAEGLATSCPSDGHPDRKQLLDMAVSMMIQGLMDPISNVRLTAADAIVKFIKSGNLDSREKDIRSALTSRNSDDDDDVRRLAMEGLSIL